MRVETEIDTGKFQVLADKVLKLPVEAFTVVVVILGGLKSDTDNVEAFIVLAVIVVVVIFVVVEVLWDM